MLYVSYELKWIEQCENQEQNQLHHKNDIVVQTVISIKGKFFKST